MRFYVTPGELTKKRNIELLTAADNKIEIHSDTGITKEQLVKLEKALQAKLYTRGRLDITRTKRIQ